MSLKRLLDSAFARAKKEGVSAPVLVCGLFDIISNQSIDLKIEISEVEKMVRKHSELSLKGSDLSIAILVLAECKNPNVITEFWIETDDELMAKIFEVKEYVMNGRMPLVCSELYKPFLVVDAVTSAPQKMAS